MKNPNLAIRTALANNILNAITYQSNLIPAYEEYVQVTESRPIAILTVGNMSVESYIILLNQTANDSSNTKCSRKDDCSIQIQITTVFPANKGGSKIAEEISELVLSAIYTNGNLIGNITLAPPFNVIECEVVTNRNINFDTNTNRVWTTQLVLNFKVNQ